MAEGKSKAMVFVRSEESTSGAAAFTGEQRNRGSMQYANLSESNVGFQLLKKAGWKEGTGLGASEQGRLNPVETCLKLDKRGIGAEIRGKKVAPVRVEQEKKPKKKTRALSKAAKMALAEEERYQEQELAREFMRQFWPDNV